MFKEGGFYTHRKMLDCMFLVEHIRLIGSSYHLDIKWFTKKGRWLGTDEIVINRDRIEDWKQCSTE